MGLHAWLKRLVGQPPADQAAESDEDRLWRENYISRQSYFESTVGPLPRDILKMFNLSGLWPGGGLFAIPATKLVQGQCAYTSFGLSNPDMPYPAGGADEPMRQPAPAGYGCEVMVLAEPDAKWAINLLQWAVNAEISGGADLLGRVEGHDGLTVEDVRVGASDADAVHVLIAKAQAPLPTGAQLPAGNMQLLVATVITGDEMAWSREHGRGALLGKLQEAGVGQVSVRGRASVVG